MKFYMEKSVLQEAVNTVIRAVPGKSTIPAMEGVLMEAQGDCLTFTGYNMLVGIRTRVEADIDREGRMVINAKLFSELIRKLPDDTVSLDCGSGVSTFICCGDTSYTIEALSADDFPSLPEVGETQGFVIEEATLKSMIDDTVYAVSTNEARPAQTGALFELGGGKLHVVACDGFRLAVRTEDAEGDAIEFIVPGNALNEVERLCDTTGDGVKVSVGGRHIIFTIGETELICRRLEGEFLNWRGVLPKDQPIAVKVNATELIQCLDRVGVVVNEKLKSPVRCKVGKGGITLSARTNLGAASDLCKIEGDGGGLDIGFNNRYLSEALRHTGESELIMRMKDAISPVVITAAEDSGRFVCMVLPVRFKND